MELKLTKMVEETKTVYLDFIGDRLIVMDAYDNELASLMRFYSDGSIYLYKWINPKIGFKLGKDDQIWVRENIYEEEV